ncbi:MAG: NYN domain-containing protein [Calditrichaeota bacterium]|nr:MAG: NYN domain-containing protein [Calditrichota bacterium]
MEIKKVTRISIFIDYDNFSISYSKINNIKEKDITIWDKLNGLFLSYYKNKFINNEFEAMEHTGTFLCVGISDFLVFEQEKLNKKHFQALDRKLGFIIRYGNRAPSKKDKKGIFQLGKEKGVDAEIICQMLMGAFLDHYDACILMSDDGDYIPAIRRVQEYFGKKVIQAGFHDSKLRNQAFGHIPLEKMSADFHELEEVSENKLYG